MKKNLSDYLVALAVIACSVVLLGALTVALSGYRLKKPTRTLQIDYKDVTGIHLASELRYAGAAAGHVINVRLLNADERKADETKLGVANAVRITVEINADVPPIPDDASASINSDTLLSEKFISLDAGTPIGEGPADKPVQELANNAVIQGHPNGLDQLLTGGGNLMPKLNDLIADVQSNVLPGVNKTVGDVDMLINTSAKKTVGDVDKLVNNADTLVDEKSSLHATLDLAKDAVAKLQGIEANLDDVLKKAGVLVTDANGNIDSRMKELSVVLENLKVATTYLKSFTKQLGEKPNRVIFTGKTEKQPAEEDILKSQKPVPAP